MIEQSEKILNCKKHLRDNLQLIIEAFVTYYGEEKRQEIEEKFNKAIIVAYRNPETTKLILNEISESNSNEILSEVFKRIPSQWTQKDLFDHL